MPDDQRSLACALVNFALSSPTCSGLMPSMRAMRSVNGGCDANIDGIQVTEGSAIAMVDGRLCCTARTPDEAAMQAIDAVMAEEEGDVITLYFGQPATEDQARALAEAVEDRHPDVDVDVLDGGQPYYHYIISVE